LLNQLGWHVQQAWLLPVLDNKKAVEHANGVYRTLTELPLELQPALFAEARKRLEDLLLSRRDEWDRLFCSPGHREEIEGAAFLLRSELQDDRDLSPSRLSVVSHNVRPNLSPNAW